MRKNSNFKNISYSNYEFISVFIIIIMCTFIGTTPENIITTCGPAGITGTLLICIVVFIIYKVLTKYIFNNEYDIFEVIKNTYPKTIQKIIGIIFYLFCLMFIYILISNIVYNLKTTTYSQSTTFGLAIYFIVAIFLFARQGFNSVFRISGYISGLILIYILLLAILSIPFISISNYFPILGNGFKEVFVDNFKNISVFAPLFFTLFFGGTIKNSTTRSNNKNFNKIFIFTAIPLFIIVVMFVGTMPTELLDTRFTLLFDSSRLVSFSTTSVKIAPIMIFMFSMTAFIASTFVMLVGCMSLERTKVIKDYTKILMITIAIIAIIFLLPQSLIYYANIEKVFNSIAIALCFGFPILTILIHSIRFGGKKKKLNIEEKQASIKKTFEEVVHYE